MAKKKPTIADLEELNADLTDKWKRALADYQNLQKRIETQQANYIRLASVGIIGKLLPILDDLERAEAHTKDDGIGMIIKQFQEMLKSEGVELIQTEGEAFDPERMDCVEMVPGKKNEIVSVQQKGYLMHDNVLRPAKVQVGSGQKSS